MTQRAQEGQQNQPQQRQTAAQQNNPHQNNKTRARLQKKLKEKQKVQVSKVDN